MASSPKKKTIRNRVGTRPATAADAEFVFLLTEATMRSYVEDTWGRWDADVVRASFHDNTHTIIQLDGTDIGCIEWIEEQTHFYLSKLYILPAHQNLGIGTQLLEEFLSTARTANKKVLLRVLRVNPAQDLYRRLGFTVRSETPERLIMEFDADNLR